MLIKFCLLIGSFATSHGTELTFEAFIEDIIETWQLRSPTIILKDDLPQMCMSLQWLLCLSNDQDVNQLANHMDKIHQGRKQDGLIFIGNQGHENLLKQLSQGAPYILTPNYPVFMPISYQKYIQFRLDSNILFYSDNNDGTYELNDIFAVKGGPSMELEVGKWSVDHGLILLKSKNRWERRNNLKQSTFVNCFANNPGWAEFIKDKNGNNVGSEGYFIDMLSYITDNLNLTIEIVEASWEMELLPNGSWTSTIGFLQRKEADVVSSGIGVNLQRSYSIDHPIPTHVIPITLTAAIPVGVSPNMWVYLTVFGVYQWVIFIALLVLMVMGFTIINITTEDLSGREFGTKRGTNNNYKINSLSSALSMVCLYTIQMGSHTNSKKFAPRLLTFTMSILTLFVFAFYTTDITAQMTSGPSDIPIRTFEDVLHHNYKVIARTSYDENTLASSKPGTAKLAVYRNLYEKKKDLSEALNAVIQDSDGKTLFYSPPIVPQTLSDKMLTDKVFPLKMDDSVKAIVGLALQKNSEFFQVFNHYILKALEFGEFKRLYRNYHTDLFIKENFEMAEPQPLGWNNVMFCFYCLGFGICLSLMTFIMESIKKKMLAKSIERGDGVRWATTRGTTDN